MNAGKASVNSLIEQITQIRGRNIPFFRPKSALLTTEACLVLFLTPLLPTILNGLAHYLGTK